MPEAARSGGKSTTQSKAEKRAELSMRALALTGLALDAILARRDPVAALVKAYDADPKAFIDWLMKHAEPKDEQAKGGNTLNLNGLFGLVAKQAEAGQLRVLPPATDAEYTEVGVHHGYEASQPIEEEW
jgi:hypothetical protein